MSCLPRSGYKVVTTCSPKNFKLVETYGTERAFDYHSPTCGEDIREYTDNSLEYVLDVITEARTIRHCYSAIGRGGGRYCGFELLPDDLIATMRKSVKADWVMGLEMTGLEIDLPGGYYRKATLSCTLGSVTGSSDTRPSSQKEKSNPIQSRSTIIDWQK